MSSFDVSPAQEGQQIEAVVKWFNLSKGFGFVAPTDGSPDAFMHVSVLTRAGLQQVAEGTKLLVQIGQGPKGRQILQIDAVLGQADPESAQPPVPTGPTDTLTGSVKWFKTEKGFGFVAADDGGKDIFVHKSLLTRLGLVTLEPLQKVRMQVHTASKGREATSIELIDSVF